jgi:hypothetical protein
VRITGTLVMLVGLMATSLWGSDDHFPFVPFKMYAFTHDPDGWAHITRLELVNAEGERFEIDDEATGLRKAEVEGQLSRFREDPNLLRFIAEAYEKAHPDEPEIVTVEIRIRSFELRDGVRTGEETDVVEVAWTEEQTQ